MLFKALSQLTVSSSSKINNTTGSTNGMSSMQTSNGLSNHVVDASVSKINVLNGLATVDCLNATVL